MTTTSKVEEHCAECEKHAEAYGVYSDERGYMSGLLVRSATLLREMEAELSFLRGYYESAKLLSARAEKAEKERDDAREEAVRFGNRLRR